MRTTEDIWESFFNDPLLKRIIEEAEMVDSDSDPEFAGDEEQAPQNPTAASAPAPEGQAPEEGGINLEQLAADFQQGNLNQDELIKLYQTGKISKEDIQQIMNQAEDSEEPQTEEELLSQQIDQTNDMFIKFALYDKISDLTEKLNYFKENFDDIQADIYERVLQLREFLNILSSLIFSIETPVSYQMYGSILLQLTELFDEYNQEQEAEEEAEDKEDELVADAKEANNKVDLNTNFEDFGQDHEEEMYAKNKEKIARKI